MLLEAFILYIVLSAFFILFLTQLPKLINLINAKIESKNKKGLINIEDESLEIARKVKEMSAIEKENFVALGNIKIFLGNNTSSLDNNYLKEVIVPEFNSSVALESDRIPLNLSDKKLRKLILEKAEEYYTTNNPLLEILAESFLAQTRRDLSKKRKT